MLVGREIPLNEFNERFLDAIVDSLPNDLFETSTRKEIRRLLVPFGVFFIGLWICMRLPWYSLPFGWIFLTFGFMALFSLNHDCIRGSFSHYPRLNLAVGTLLSAPLLQPYEPTRLLELARLRSIEEIERIVQGRLTFVMASVRSWLSANFTALPRVWVPGHRKKIVLSYLVLHSLTFLVFGGVLALCGVWTLLKLWILPWVGYHVAMAVFYKWVYQGRRRNGARPIPQSPAWFKFVTNDILSVLSMAKVLSLGTSAQKMWAEQAGRLKAEAGTRREPAAPPDDAEPVLSGPRTPPLAFGDEPIDAPMLPLSIPLFTHPHVSQFIDRLRRCAVAKGLQAPPAVGPEIPAIPPAYRHRLKEASTSQVNWVTAAWLFGTPLIAAYGLYSTPIRWPTAAFGLILYILTGLGITVGYHRYYAHCSYRAKPCFAAVFLILATATFQGSALWWSKGHRAHHQFVDTEMDPYNRLRGFWYSHMGWLLRTRKREAYDRIIKVDDLLADPLVVFQHKHYMLLALLSGLVVPTAIAGLLWGDWRGGFYFASMLRIVAVMQSTFCINSLAHTFGDHTFTDRHTPRDCFWVSLLTFGEGYHNFHHEFPYDYRNGVFFFSFDPSKWLIYLATFLRATWNLKRCPNNEIELGRLQAIQRRVSTAISRLYLGPAVDLLPKFSNEEFKAAIRFGAHLIIIDGYVHDVTVFAEQHPGGVQMLRNYVGLDATAAFHGKVYKHSDNAHNILKYCRVGRYVGEVATGQIEAAAHLQFAPREVNAGQVA